MERNVRPGTPLFVQDSESGVMHGLFEASGPPSTNGPDSKLPVVIPFRVVLGAPVVAMNDPQVSYYLLCWNSLTVLLLFS